MDDDDRGVHAALVGITQFGAEHARPLGGLKLHRFQQQPRQNRGGHFASGRKMGLGNRGPYRPQALAGLTELHLT